MKNKENKGLTQKTPKGHEIPIPKRGDVLQMLKKAAHTPVKSTKRSPKK
jgi:hypothetical protein